MHSACCTYMYTCTRTRPYCNRSFFDKDKSTHHSMTFIMLTLNEVRVLNLYRRLKVVLRPTSCSVIENGKKIKLLCDDEPERRYHGVWLRHNCRCPQCLSASSRQTVVVYEDLRDVKITGAHYHREGTLNEYLLIIISTETPRQLIQAGGAYEECDYLIEAIPRKEGYYLK